MCRCIPTDAMMTANAVSVIASQRCVVYADGSVRWLGVRWYGLPYPLRIALWLKYRDRWAWRYVRRLPGCGCIARLKDGWTRLKGLVLFGSDSPKAVKA